MPQRHTTHLSANPKRLTRNYGLQQVIFSIISYFCPLMDKLCTRSVRPPAPGGGGAL